uniref:Uncharacterized protein n=1 Tax=Alexandrium monilatum TaxID=311494 RepID=A0A7S4W324_9DINO
MAQGQACWGPPSLNSNLSVEAPVAMKRFKGSLVCLALLAGGVQSARINHPPKPADSHACKSMCQRFGMKLLASFWSDFKGVTSPTPCCDVCDKVLPAPSLAQLRDAAPPPAAAAATAASSASTSVPEKTGASAGVPPVKR